jgi:hypothetical protein
VSPLSFNYILQKSILVNGLVAAGKVVEERCWSEESRNFAYVSQVWGHKHFCAGTLLGKAVWTKAQWGNAGELV